MFYFDSTYILVLMGALIVIAAQQYVANTFSKYSQFKTDRNITGKQAAEYLLEVAGIGDVRVEKVAGQLTDHYDPHNKVLRLSEATYNKTSVAAVAVAAHECGHAIQDNEDYFFLRLRSSLVPVVNLGSQLAIPMLLIGILLSISGLITLGIILFSLTLLFQLVTLPVEFDASSRAIDMLHGQVFTAQEVPVAKKVLRAAAFTYIASTLSVGLQLLRFILISNRRRD